MLKWNFEEGRVGVKTEYCPGVSGICPGLAGILSRSVLNFVSMWPDSKGGTWRTGSPCFAGKPVKIDVDTGAAASLVPQMQCTYHRPRARARWGQTYVLGDADQVQSVQVGMREVQRGG